MTKIDGEIDEYEKFVILANRVHDMFPKNKNRHTLVSHGKFETNFGPQDQYCRSFEEMSNLWTIFEDVSYIHDEAFKWFDF